MMLNRISILVCTFTLLLGTRLLHAADTDGDSMSDAFETANGYNSSTAEWDIDADGDRIPNRWEAAFGTDGGSSSSKPAWASSQSTTPKYYVVDGTLSSETTFQKKTIAAAITAAVDLSIIEIKAGTYAESPSIPTSKRLFIFGSQGTKYTRVTGTWGISSPCTLENLFLDRRSSASSSTLQIAHSSATGTSFLKSVIVLGGNTGVEAASGTAVKLLHCTITGAATYGIYLSSGTAEAVNSAVWGNGTYDAYRNSGTLTLRNCVVASGKAYNTTNVSVTSLTSEQTMGWNGSLQLQTGSPAINAGIVQPEVLVDGDLEVRTNTSGNLPDIGVDEFSDADSDGLPDWMETAGATDVSGDYDNDGATNLVEYQAGTNPLVPDTDGDSVKDGFELARAPLLNPFVQELYEDPDGDHIPNLWEMTWGTDGGDVNSKPSTAGAGPSGTTVNYYVVDPSGTNSTYQKTALSAAVTAATDLSIIELKPGIHGTATWDIPASKRLLVFSSAGARRTICTYTSAISSASVIDGIGFDSRTGISSEFLRFNSYGIRVRNCVMRGAGYGIWVGSYSSSSALLGPSVVEHCTITGNTYYGAYFSNSYPVTFVNCIVTGNGSADAYGTYYGSRFESCVVGLNRVGSAFQDANCLKLDTTASSPTLPIINTLGIGTGTGYALQTGSPLINKGRVMASLTTDYDAETRANSIANLPDIGVDEFNDSDSDDLPDWMETAGATEPGDDYDNDGATNLAEYQAGTNPLVADTDGDSVKDGFELARTPLLNPFVQEPYEDPDGDHIPSLWEVAWGTDGGDANSKPGTAGAGPGGSISYYVVDPAGTNSTYQKTALSAAVTASSDLSIIELKPGVHGSASWDIPASKRLLVFSSAGARRTICTYTSAISSASVIDGIGFDSRTGISSEFLRFNSYGIRVRNCVMRGAGYGIWVGSYSSSSALLGPSVVEHCTITANTSYGIYFSNSYPVTFVNSIVAGNGVADAYGTYYGSRFESCVVGLNRVGSAFQDTNCLKLDTTASSPTLPIINTLGIGTGTGYALQTGSPLINKGRVMASLTTDYDAETRANSIANLPDIGVDEFNDSDSDDLPDWMETAGATEPGDDYDNDGATNLAEYQAGTNPFNADTDGDSVKDGFELTRKPLLNPFVQEPYEDPDGDHIPNLWEVAWGTDGGDVNSKPGTAGAGPGGSISYYVVDPAGTNSTYQKTALSAAVTASTDLSIIELKPGVHGSASWDIPASKRLLVFSSAGARRTICTYTSYISSASVIDGIGFDSRTGISSEFLRFNSYGIRVRNCVMRGAGYGIWVGSYSSSSALLGPSVVEHCTITANTSYGIYFSNSYPVTFVNSIVAGNGVADASGTYSGSRFESCVVGLGRVGSATLDSNCLKLDTTASSPTLPIINTLGTGTGTGYALQTGSPLINKGRVMASLMPDYDAETRANSIANLPDIGVDEFNDSDSDDLPDWMETAGATEPGEDYDNDGATNLAEYQAGTNPFNADTDGDSVKDGFELARTPLLNPLVQEPYEDPDGDRIPNLWEVAWGTDGGDANSKPGTAGAGPGGSISYYVVDPAGTNSTYQKTALSAAVTASTDLSIIELKPGIHGTAAWDIPSSKRLLVFSSAGARRTICTYSSIISSPSVIDGIGFDSRTGISSEFLRFASYGIRVRNCVMRGGGYGIYVSSYNGSSLLGPSMVEHCTITGNTYGAYFYYSNPVIFVNSILAGNSTMDGYSASSAIKFESCVVGLNRVGSASLDSNTLKLDTTASSPTLPIINTLGIGTGTGYALQTGSPLINKGRVMASLTTDYDAEIRVNSIANRPDIGVDEFNDSDSDDLPDWMETAGATEPGEDYDSDGATNLAEYQTGTNPLVADTDGDSMKDGFELARLAFLNPFVQEPYEDPDGDHIPNLWEVAWGTDGGDANSKPGTAGAGPGGSISYYVVDPAGTNSTYQKTALSAAVTAATDLSIIELKPGIHGTAAWDIPSSKRLLVFSSAGARRTTCTYSSIISSASVIDGIGFDSRTGISSEFLRFNSYGIRVRNCVMRGGGYGIYVSSYNGSSLLGPSIVEHCTITGNTYGAYFYYSNPVTFVNSILAGNSTMDGYSASSAIKFESCVVGLNRVGSASLDSNTLKLDTTASSPTLPIINTLGIGTGTGYALQTGSPLINKGRVMASLTTDYDAEIRVNSIANLPDIGVDEFNDSDNNGLPDWMETAGATDPGEDYDSDGATNLAEYQAGTNPFNADTDGDSMKDGFELARKPLLNPFVQEPYEDPDGDHIPNLWEVAWGTDGGDANSKPGTAGAGPGGSISYYVVDPAGTNSTYQKTALSAAVTASTDLSIIELKPGVHGTAAWDIPSSKRLLVFSSAGAQRTFCTYSSIISSPSVIDGIAFDSRTGASAELLRFNSYGIRVRNCVMRGGVYGIYVSSYNGSSLLGPSMVEHCTITGNTYGAYFYYSNPVTFVNSILAGNSTMDGYSASSAIKFESSVVGLNRVGSAVLDSNCLKLDTTASSPALPIINDLRLRLDYHLHADSPLRNKGRITATAVRDTDTELRPNCTADLPDVGADEFLDSDGDFVPDSVIALAGADEDGDGANALAEWAAGTHIAYADTDLDGMTDGYEIANGLQPALAIDGGEDPDGDRIPNFFEAGRNSDPQNALSPAVPDLTIDGSQTSSGTRYQTFAAAIAAASDWQIIEVKPGTYTADISIPANKRLMFYSTAGAKTTILRPLTSGADSVSVSGAVVLDGFTITHNTSTAGYSVKLNGTGSSMLRGCSLNGHASTIGVQGSTGCVFIQHCTSQGSSYSIAITGLTPCVMAVNSVFKGPISTADVYSLHLSNSLYSQTSPNVTLVGTNYREQTGYSGADPAIFASAGVNADGSLAANSPLINKGRVIANAGPLYDFDGLLRSNTTGDLPDVGVDEASDTDSDGLPDWWEMQYFGSLTQTGSGDGDGDGLTNLQEIAALTDPTLADTDDDGLSDSAELSAGRNPRVRDTTGSLSVSPVPGLYSSTIEVAITCSPEADAAIYYTTDGSEPTSASSAYTGPFTVATTTRVRARGFKLNFVPTPVIDVGYGVHADSAQLPAGGVKLWLRSDEGLTLDSSNHVQQWNDLSGAGNHLSQSSSVKRPATVISSLAFKTAVRFDGLDDSLQNSNVTNFPARWVTAFVVSRPLPLASTEPRRGLLSWWTSSHASEYGITVDPASGLGFAPFRRTLPPNSGTTGGFPPFAPLSRATDQYDAVIITLDTDNHQFKLYQGGALSATGNGATWYNTVKIPTAGSLALGALQQTVSGAPSATRHMPGEVAEVLVYDRLLNETEIGQLQTWFGTHYGETLARPVATPAPGVYPNSVSVTLTSASPGADIRYTTDGSTPVETSSAFTSGTPVSLSSHGTTTIKARAFRAGANTSGTSAFVYTVDTQAPVISNVRFSGTAFPEDTEVTAGGSFQADATDLSGINRVEFFIDDQLLATDTTAADGYTFAWKLTGAVDDGAHALKVRAWDAFQTSTELSVPFTVALAPPSAPVFTSPAASQIVGSSTFNLVGTAAEGAKVNIYVGETLAASGLGLDSTGKFKYSVTLQEGENSVTAKAFFRNGQLGDASAARVLTYDSTEPEPPTGVVLEQRPGGSLRVKWVPAEAGSKAVGFNVYRSLAEFTSTTASGVTKLTSGGGSSARLYNDTPSSSVTTAVFYRVTAIDAAGHESALSASVNAVPDRTGPGVAATYAASASVEGPPVRYGPGPIGVTLVFSEPLGGDPFVAMKPNGRDAEPLVITKISAPPGSSGPAYSATWTAQPSTPTGTVTLVVTAFDVAGNPMSGVTQGSTLSLDTLGPVVMELDLPNGLQTSSATPAQVTLHAVLDDAVFDAEGLPAAPVFTYTLSQTSPTVALPVTASPGSDALHWTLSFTLPSNAGATPETLKLAIAARDRLGNAGAAFFMDPVVEVFQSEPQAPAIPANLTAVSKPAGHVQLSWQSAARANTYRLLRGTQADGSDLAVIPAASALSAATLTFDDLPDTDGTYYYAVEALRTSAGQSIASGLASELLVAESDRLPPAAPQDLVLTLTAQGIQSTWSAPDADAVSCSLYRASASITSIESLTPLLTSIAAPPVTDANTTSAQTWYAVAAVDAAGNISAPSVSQHMNVDLLPVAGLTLTWNTAGGGTPTLAWPARGGSVTGYTVRVFADATTTTAFSTTTISSPTTTQYQDTTFPGTPPRTFSVAARDAVEAESLQRKLTLPDAVFKHQPVAGSPAKLLKGVLNHVPFQVTAGSIALSHARVEISHGSEVWKSAEFNLAADASTSISVLVPGDESLPDTQASLTAALVVTPHENESVRMTQPLVLPVETLGLQVGLQPAGFTKGGNGRVRFTLANPGTDTLEFISATGTGTQPSPDLKFILQDRDGNTLLTQQVKITYGSSVFQLTNGTTVIRVEPGETFTSAEISLPVPLAAPDELLLFFQGERTWYRHSQPDELAIESSFSVGTVANAAATAYTAVLDQAVVDVNQPRRVALLGHATYTATSSNPTPGPAGRQPVLIKVSRGAADATFSGTTAADGTFTWIYEHPVSEPGGVFTAWAMHPDRTDRDSQVTFSIFGVQATPAEFLFAAPRDYPTALTTRVTAGAGTSLTSLRLELHAEDQAETTGAAGLTGIALDCPSINLATGASANLPFTFRGNANAASTGRITARLTGVASGETTARVWQYIELKYNLGEARPLLSAVPNLLQTGVNPGQETLETVVFQNTGYAPLVQPAWRLLTDTGAAPPAWAQVLTEAPSSSSSGADATLAIGDKQSIQLRFAPPEGTSPALYQFRLRLSGANYPATDYTVLVEVTEAGEGTLAVQIVDAFSPSDGLGGFTKGVAGATATYTNEDVPTITGTASLTDTTPQGLLTFEDLPAGRYHLRVNGPRHDSAIRRLRIRPSVTTTEQVQLRYLGVQVTWSVTEKTIKDTYEIKANMTFETNLPVASLVTEPANIVLPDLKKGEVFSSEFILTNVGGVRADRVELNLPDDTSKVHYVLRSSVPASLLPGEQVRIGWTAVAKEDLVSSTVAMAPAKDDSLLAGIYKEVNEEMSPFLRSRTADMFPAVADQVTAKYLPSHASDGGPAVDTSGLFADGGGTTTGGDGRGPCYTTQTFRIPYHFVCSNGTEYDNYVEQSVLVPAPCPPVSPHTPREYPPYFPTWSGAGGGGFGLYGGTPTALSDKVECWPDHILPCVCDNTCDTPGSGQKQPGGSWVDLINRWYQDSITDITVNTAAGPISIVRSWTGKKWLWNLNRSLKIYDGHEGKIIGIVRQGVLYRPVGDHPSTTSIIRSTVGSGSGTSTVTVTTGGGTTHTNTTKPYFAGGPFKIEYRVGGGYRWESPTGEWETFNGVGQMLERGYAKRTLFRCTYPDEGAERVNGYPPVATYPNSVRDEFGNVIFTISAIAPNYQRITSITDVRNSRTLVYSWQDWKLGSLVRPAGLSSEESLVWTYDYNDAGQITKRRDADGHVTTIEYEDPTPPLINVQSSSGGGSGGSVSLPVWWAEPTPPLNGHAIKRLNGPATGDQAFTFSKDSTSAASMLGGIVNTTSSSSGSYTSSISIPSSLLATSSTSNSEKYAKVVFTGGAVNEYWFRPDGVLLRRAENGVPVKVVDGTSTYDGLGRVTIQTVNTGGKINEVIFPDGSSISRGFDESNVVPKRFTDRRGAVTEVEYNEDGYPTIVREAVGTAAERSKELEYYGSGSSNSLSGYIKSITDSLGHKISFQYTGTGISGGGSSSSDEPQGLVRKVIDSSNPGLNTTYFYDKRGNVIRKEEDNGRTEGYFYDWADRLLRYRNAVGETTIYTYTGTRITKIESYARIGSSMDSAVTQHGSTEEWVYEENGLIASYYRRNSPSAPRRLVESYEYDEAGRLTSRRNALGNITETYDYDVRGRVTKMYVPHPTLGTVSSEWKYNQLGEVLEYVAPDGTRTTYTYDEKSGLHTGTTEAAGTADARTTLNGYNSAGDLTSLTYVGAGPGGTNLVTHFGYDVLGRHVTTSGDRVIAETNEYNSNDDIVATVDALGNRRTYEFNPFHRITKRWEPAVSAADNGGVAQEPAQTSFYYDGRGLLSATQDANGIWQFIAYDDVGRTTHVSLPATEDLRSTSWTSNTALVSRSVVYDQFGRVASSYIAGSGTTTYTYDEANNRTTVTLPGGWQTVTQFDALDRQVSITYAASIPAAEGGSGEEAQASTQVYEWSTINPNFVVTARDRTGTQTKYSYDRNFRLLTTTLSSGAVQSVQYDLLGRAIRKTTTPSEAGAAPRVSHHTYDFFDQPLRHEWSDHDANAADGTATARVETFTYDRRGLVISHQGTATETVTYEWDANGRNKAMIDGSGHRTSFEYDSHGRLVRKIYQDGSTDRWRYDVCGRMTHRVLAGGPPVSGVAPSGQTTIYSYNKFDKITHVDYPTDADVDMDYDAVGRLTAIARVQGSGARTGEVLYGYDSYGRVISETQTDVNRTIVATWTRNGLRRSTTVHLGNASGPVERTVAYSHDRVGRALTITDSALGNGQAPFSYSYDDAKGGRIASLTTAVGVKAQWSHNSIGEMHSLTWSNSQSDSIASFGITRNTSGYTTEITSSVRGLSDLTQGFGYDHRRRLVSATSTGPGAADAPSSNWNWDGAGNPTTRQQGGTSNSFASNNLNQITAINGTAAQYSPEGNLTLYAPPLQPGSLGVPGIVTMGYDEEQRLRQVVDAATSRTTTYGYDANGRRVSANYAQSGASSSSRTIRFLYDVGSTRPIAELDAGGTVLRWFVWGLDLNGTLEGTDGVGGLVAIHDIAARSSSDITTGDRYVAVDQGGNVVSLLTSNGVTLAAWRYDPFGNEVANFGTSEVQNSCSFRHATRWKDAWAGPPLLAYAKRWYSPDLGRFLSRDPAGEAAALNLYDFNYGSSINLVDVYGNHPVLIIGGGALIGALFEGFSGAIGAMINGYPPQGVMREFFKGALRGGIDGAIAAGLGYIIPGGGLGGGALRGLLESLLSNIIGAEFFGDCFSWQDVLAGAALNIVADKASDLFGHGHGGGGGPPRMSRPDPKPGMPEPRRPRVDYGDDSVHLTPSKARPEDAGPGVGGKPKPDGAMPNAQSSPNVAPTRAPSDGATPPGTCPGPPGVDARGDPLGCFVGGTPIATDSGSRAIESIKLGDRVLTSSGDSSTEIDLAASKAVKMRVADGSSPGKFVEIDVLRSDEWVARNHCEEGKDVWIDIHEIGVAGWAKVLCIRGPPEIQPGKGRVVLGTFTRTGAAVLEIRIEGQSAPLRVTENHPLYSDSRLAWVAAGELAQGEKLRTQRGTILVESVTPSAVAVQVYNLEVEGEHHYFAGDAAILAHNNCVSTGAGRDHVTYTGFKDGKPYVGYASAPSSLGLSPEGIIDYRYQGDFGGFGGIPPSPVQGTHGSGIEGKALARGTEQKIFQQNVIDVGFKGQANLQNPVGPGNDRLHEYMNAAGVPYDPKYRWQE